MTNAHYCPNCDAEVSSGAKSCPTCFADFGSNSTWKPVTSRLRRASPRAPIFSGEPKIVHAAQSIAIFAILGPVGGLFLVAVLYKSSGDLAFAFHPFAIIGAFAVGGGPALIAGFLYCVAALGLVALFPQLKIRILAGAVIGVLAGYAGVWAYFHLVLQAGPSRAARVDEVANLSSCVGLLCGAVSAWLVPVGRSGAGSSPSDA